MLTPQIAPLRVRHVTMQVSTFRYLAQRPYATCKLALLWYSGEVVLDANMSSDEQMCLDLMRDA